MIIDGIGDIENSHLLIHAKTIQDLKDLMERYEHRLTRGVPAANANRSQQALRPKNTAAARPVIATHATAAPAATDMTTIRCFNCTKLGHYQSQCPHEKRNPKSCFKCWGMGHGHHDCPNPKKQLPNMLPIARTVAAALRTDELAEIEATEAIEAINLVSVAFLNVSSAGTKFTDVVSLFDTGNPISFMRRSQLPYDVPDSLKPTKFCGLGGQNIKTLGEARCKIKFKNQTEELVMIVLPDEAMLLPLILGRDFLKKFNVFLSRMNLMYSRGKLIQLNEAMSTGLSKQTYFCAPLSNKLTVAKRFDLCRNIKPMHPSASCCNSTNDILTVAPEEIEGKIMTDVPQIFAIECFENDRNELILGENLFPADAERVGRLVDECYLNPTDVKVEPIDYEMKIRLTSDVPFHCTPRKLSQLEKTEVNRSVGELLQEGVIQPSDWPYASAVVLVRNKNGKMRMCVDYRGLNKLTIRDNYSLPLIENCIEYLERKKHFTVLDLKNGFHQVKVADDSVKYTAFVTPNGQYEYRRMPFGLRNAPSVFQRFINTIFKDLIDAGLIVIYIDDLLLATADCKEHMRLLKIILDRLAKRGLRLNLGKCGFGFDEIEFLGYSVSSAGISPSGSHTAAIQKYPLPTNARALHSCLGLFSYFRRFVPQFSSKAATEPAA